MTEGGTGSLGRGVTRDKEERYGFDLVVVAWNTNPDSHTLGIATPLVLPVTVVGSDATKLRWSLRRVARA